MPEPAVEEDGRDVGLGVPGRVEHEGDDTRLGDPSGSEAAECAAGRRVRGLQEPGFDRHLTGCVGHEPAQSEHLGPPGWRAAAVSDEEQPGASSRTGCASRGGEASVGHGVRPSIRVEVDGQRAAAGLLAPGSAHRPPSSVPEGRSDIDGSCSPVTAAGPRRTPAGFPCTAAQPAKLDQLAPASYLQYSGWCIRTTLPNETGSCRGRLHPSRPALRLRGTRAPPLGGDPRAAPRQAPRRVRDRGEQHPGEAGRRPGQGRLRRHRRPGEDPRLQPVRPCAALDLLDQPLR